MIAKYISSDSIASSIMYNESKVKEGHAKLFGTRNVHFEPKNPREKIELLNYLANSNHRVKKKSTHIILSFSPKDILSKEKMQNIVDDYMIALGFGDQPAFIYQHLDTDSPHLHIVTTPVKFGGEKIDTAFIKLRSNTIRQDLEKKYNLVVAEEQKKQHDISEHAKNSRQFKQIKLKEAMENMKFSSVAAYFDYMQTLGIAVDIKQFEKKGVKKIGLMYHFDEKCKPIKASNLYMKPTAQRIAKRVSKPINKTLNNQYDRILALPAEDIYVIVNDKEGTVTLPEDMGLSKQVIRDIYAKSIQKPKVEKPKKLEIDPVHDAKKLATLISRMYQAYKKEEKIYYESSLIDKFPKELFIDKLSNENNLSNEIAREAVESFYNYKLSQKENIIDKESDYFAKKAVNVIYFVNKMPIDEISKHCMLNKFGVNVSEHLGRVHSIESDLVGFNLIKDQKVLNKTNGDLKIPYYMNDATNGFIKKWFEDNKPPFAGPDIDPSIIELLKEMGFIKKKEAHEELGISKEHFEHLVNLVPSQYQYDQEKFLRESNVNRVRQMRRTR
jgi:hypothetical protein